MTGSVIVGSPGFAGAMTHFAGEPEQPVPVTLNAIVSRVPALALDRLIASRSEPTPVSLVLVTVIVAAKAAAANGNAATSVRRRGEPNAGTGSQAWRHLVPFGREAGRRRRRGLGWADAMPPVLALSTQGP